MPDNGSEPGAHRDAGQHAGLGVILTPCGLVLTSAQVLQSARRLTVRVVLSGRFYPARLVGTDHSQGLSLLQIAGGPAFRPVALGNSRYLSRGAAVTAVGSAGLTFAVPIDTGSRRGQADPGLAFAVSRRIYAIRARKCHALASGEAGN